jgi:hypothetical protein
MGGRRYQYFYYHCSRYNSHGSKGCEEARFASATKLEGQVWEFVRGILLDPAELRSDLDRAIELEKEGRYGDPEAEAKHWLEKFSEIDDERRGFLRLAAKDRITDEELELGALEETRRTAERELKDLRRHKERVDQMEQDRDAVFEHYASLAPEALASLTSEERNHLYKMLRLKDWLAKSRDLEIELAGAQVDGLGGSTSITQGTSKVILPETAVTGVAALPASPTRPARSLPSPVPPRSRTSSSPPAPAARSTPTCGGPAARAAAPRPRPESLRSSPSRAPQITNRSRRVSPLSLA